MRFLFVTKQDTNDYINATLIAKDHGKKANDWLRVNKTKELVDKISKALNIQPDVLIVTQHGGPSTGGGTWIHPALKNVFEIWCKSKTSIAIPELYVVLFNTGVLKVVIEKNPKITEEELIEFCNQNGTLHHGSEYFTNLNYDKVVNFLKRKIERKVLRLVRSNNE